MYYCFLVFVEHNYSWIWNQCIFCRILFIQIVKDCNDSTNGFVFNINQLIIENKATFQIFEQTSSRKSHKNGKIMICKKQTNFCQYIPILTTGLPYVHTYKGFFFHGFLSDHYNKNNPEKKIIWSTNNNTQFILIHK